MAYLKEKNFTLYKGQQFKNFTDLKDYLGIKGSIGGRQKVKIIEELEQYCKLTKEGRKFIIQEVYLIPKENKKNLKYQIQSANLIVYLCATLGVFDAEKNYKVNLCKNELYEKMCLVNTSYALYKKERETFKVIDNINKKYLDWFFDTTKENNRSVLRSGLDYLEDCCLIKYKNSYKIQLKESSCLINAKEEDIYNILEAENYALKKLKLSSKSQLFGYYDTKVSDFYKEVNEYLLNNTHIEKYYSSIDILMSKDFKILINNTKVVLLKNEQVEDTRCYLNQVSIDKIINSAYHTQAKNKLETSALSSSFTKDEEEKELFRSDLFIDSVLKLTEQTIKV